MDLNQVKSLFTATDFERGMEYYRKGRVTDMQCTKTDTETNVSCTVRGAKRYTVQFLRMENGRLRINCSCPRFADVGRCKHLAAAMIAFLSGPPRERVPGSDRYARQMLPRYLHITQEPAEPSQKPIRLCALTGESFDRWCDLLSAAPVDCAGSEPLTLTQADPQVRLQIAEEGGGAWLTVQTPCPYRFFGSYRSLYALGGGKLLRCSGEFREKIYPLLEASQQTMYLARKDLPTFCGCVLPALDGQVEIEDPQNLLQNYIPDSCTVCFYFDMEQDTLLVKPVFRYDTHSIAFDDSSEPDGVRRNKKEESAALLFVRRYFQQQGQQFVLQGEDAAYDFLTGSIDAFRRRGEVYFSDRLNRKRLQPAPTSVGLSVSDGLLTLTLDTGGYPPEELSELYRSMLLRRKYHRLPDGRYLELNGSSCEKLAEMAQMLQLTGRELARGKATLPAYRALYLDELLSGSDGIQVSRDSQLRRMIRNFKKLSESDCDLPQGLNEQQRSYQQLGYMSGLTDLQLGRRAAKICPAAALSADPGKRCRA